MSEKSKNEDNELKNKKANAEEATAETAQEQSDAPEKEETEQKYDQWWSDMIEKYQLQGYPYEKLIVDAIGETIQME